MQLKEENMLDDQLGYNFQIYFEFTTKFIQHFLCQTVYAYKM